MKRGLQTLFGALGRFQRPFVLSYQARPQAAEQDKILWAVIFLGLGLTSNNSEPTLSAQCLKTRGAGL
jgi:hypothetical protein